MFTEVIPCTPTDARTAELPDALGRAEQIARRIRHRPGAFPVAVHATAHERLHIRVTLPEGTVSVLAPRSQLDDAWEVYARHTEQVARGALDTETREVLSAGC